MAAELVKIKIDGREVEVPKGTNVIEAAKKLGIEIPHYCYHPHLSIAGNCRMCQVEVKGRPKLEIGCNLGAADGLEVSTHLTSTAVKTAQAATLEFILINHPLDCTVCDRAGHCKLQDYHFEYNAQSSRFLEDKEHKVKAEVLGPNVILDGERCIMCTRCIRFCDEVTETSELGMINRGDRSVITVNKDKVLDNALSGTVVDLCPVGALTHRNWRFNTRIWFTEQKDSICTGCSTGCNVRVAIRDNDVVHVKARMNNDVNKEWLCDEGRYGFNRYLPESRLAAARVNGKELSFVAALGELRGFGQGPTLVLISSQLTLEEMLLVRRFVERELPNKTVVLGITTRELTEVQKVLISPDYDPNYGGGVLLGLSGSGGGDRNSVAKRYEEALAALVEGKFEQLLVVGEGALPQQYLTPAVLSAVGKLKQSVGMLTDATTKLAMLLTAVLPGHSPLEKSGMMINGALRLQKLEALVHAPEGSESEGRILMQWAAMRGRRLYEAANERELTLLTLKELGLPTLTIGAIKNGGVQLKAGATQGTIALEGV